MSEWPYHSRQWVIGIDLYTIQRVKCIQDIFQSYQTWTQFCCVLFCCARVFSFHRLMRCLYFFRAAWLPQESLTANFVGNTLAQRGSCRLHVRPTWGQRALLSGAGYLEGCGQNWYQTTTYKARTVRSIDYGAVTGLILGFRPANERRRYKVTPFLIGWAQPRINHVSWQGTLSVLLAPPEGNPWFHDNHPFTQNH